jgi:hypothetical protein
MNRSKIGGALLVLASASAFADVDVAVQKGDKIKGSFDPAAETETFRVLVPQGATILAKAKGSKGASAHLELRDAEGSVPYESVETGTKATLTATASSTREFRVVATSRGGAATGAYSLQVTWSLPPRTTTQRTTDTGGTVQVPFSADALAKAKVTVRPVSGSPLPRIERITGPGGFSVEIGAGGSAPTAKSRPVTLGATGDYTLHVSEQGDGGEIAVEVALTPRKPKPRTIDLTSKRLGGAGDEFAIGASLGAEGGTVTVPDLGGGGGLGDISGSSVDVPPGALPSGGVVFIGTAPTLDPKGRDAPVSPTVLFGPEGTKFASDVTVTIPIEPALIPDGEDSVTIYTRDANGKVTKVPGPYTFDLVAGTVSFPTPHFSSFVAAVEHDDHTPGGNVFVTLAAGSIADFEINTTGAGTIAYFYAEGETVRSLTPNTSSAGFTSAVWAGGGAQTADGAARLSYDFPGPIRAVATRSGQVFAATSTQIFVIDTSNDEVTRFLGDGQPADTGDGGPAAAARMIDCVDLFGFTSTDLYFVDRTAARLRRVDSDGLVQPVAGTGSSGVGPDGVDATTSQLDAPRAVTEDFSDGTLYIAERSRVRAVATDGVITTILGDPDGSTGCVASNGPNSRFTSLEGVSFAFGGQSGERLLFVADSDCHALYRYRFTTNLVEPVIGVPGTAGIRPDFTDVSRVTNPERVFTLSDGFLLFLDDAGAKLRQATFPAIP